MKVRFLRTCKPICYNLKNWKIPQSPVLLITGLSGSGKTTFAQKFAERYHAICISFDVLKFYPESSKQSQEILDFFLKRYPEIKKKITIQWAKTNRANSNDILFNYYCNLFFDFLVEYGRKNNKKLVLEGIQMFVRLHPSKSVTLPVIIIRSSCLHSFFNKLKRDYYFRNFFANKHLGFLKCIINDLYIYYFRQRKFLNIYITYLSTLKKFAR